MQIELESPHNDIRPKAAFFLTLDLSAAGNPPVKAMRQRSEELRFVIRGQMIERAHGHDGELWDRMEAGVLSARQGCGMDLTGLSDQELIDALCS